MSDAGLVAQNCLRFFGFCDATAHQRKPKGRHKAYESNRQNHVSPAQQDLNMQPPQWHIAKGRQQLYNVRQPHYKSRDTVRAHDQKSPTADHPKAEGTEGGGTAWPLNSQATNKPNEINTMSTLQPLR